MKLHYLLLAALPCLPLAANAAPSSEESVTAPETHNRELKVGDKAPDQYKRDDQAIQDWQGMGGHFVLVQITNGVVLAIQPAS